MLHIEKNKLQHLPFGDWILDFSVKVVCPSDLITYADCKVACFTPLAYLGLSKQKDYAKDLPGS